MTTPNSVSNHMSSSCNASFNDRDPFFDFRFDSLVDADDPGFASEFDDTDLEESSSDDDDGEEEQNNGTDEFFAAADATLRTLTQSLQASFLNQPKSTQLILTHEVSGLLKAYQSHGSAARLSASIFEFLDGGDIVEREVEKDVVEEQFDADGPRTGKLRMGKKSVTERARMRFEELDEHDVFGGKGKRKAEIEVEVDGMGKRERLDEFGARQDTSLALRQRSDSVRPRTAGKCFPGDDGDDMDVDGDVDLNTVGRRLQAARLRYESSGILSHPGPQNQPASSPTTNHTLAPATQRQPPPTNVLTPPPFQRLQHQQRISHLSQPTPTHRQHHHPPIPPEQYSLTTDLPTQSHLLGSHPLIPFNPLSNLSIPLPITPSTPLASLLPLIRIINLHAHSTLKHHNSLIDKYTLPDLQPPAALIRLALTTRLHADLQQMFTPVLNSEFAVGPEARALFKDVYKRFKSCAEVNDVEAGVLASAGGVDVEAVEGWWEERWKGEFAWTALRVWVERVEGWKIGEAKSKGLY